MKPTALIVLALAIPSLATAQTGRPEFPQSLDGTRDWVSFGPLSIWSDYRLGPISDGNATRTAPIVIVEAMPALVGGGRFVGTYSLVEFDCAGERRRDLWEAQAFDNGEFRWSREMAGEWFARPKGEGHPMTRMFDHVCP